MKIFLIWIGLVFCSVLNGLVFGNFPMPEKLLFMCVPSFLCVWLLYLHRKLTKEWEPYKSIWDGDRIPVFTFSFFITAIYAIIFPLSTPTGVGMITMGIASFVAFLREIRYMNVYWGGWINHLFYIKNLA